MKPKPLPFIFLIFMAPLMVSAQLFTMSNKCYDKVKAGNQQLDSARFDDALTTFSDVLANCTTKDAKEQGQVGKARALNGLQRYNEAVEASSNAINASKSTNVMAYYNRSYAYRKLGQEDEAKADLQKVTDLTAKNKNVKARATMFADMANMDLQDGMFEDAKNNVATAIQLDSKNPDFYILKGDIYAKENNYDEAFTNYDSAVSLGKNDVSIYQIRTNARIRQMQGKYNTTNANDLAAKMSANDKSLVCKELNKANELGMKNMQLDFFAAMICK